MKRREFIGCSGCLMLMAFNQKGFVFDNDLLLPVKIKDTLGYINQSGDLIIKPKFEEAHQFRCDSSVVRLSGKYGFINKSGEFFIKPQYNRAKNFIPSGYAKVLTDAGWHIINKKGENLDDIYNKSVVGHFYEGLALFLKDGNLGFIDNKGRIVIEPKFKRASGFSNGHCLIETNSGNGLKGIIDKNGDYIIQPKYKSIDFSLMI
jgi:hypothetical protein